MTRHAPPRVRSSDPLSARLYLRRMFPHLLPQWLAMSLVTLLLVVLITPSNTFHETTLANLHAVDTVTAVTPATRTAFDTSLLALLDGNTAMERRLPVKVGWIRYPMLVGETLSPLILLDADEIPALLERMSLRLVAGRLPEKGRSEMVLHQNLARATEVTLGGRVGPQVDRSQTSGVFEVVGVVEGRAHVGIGAFGSGLRALFVRDRLPTYMLIYARPGMKAASDAYLHAARYEGDEAFQVVDGAYVRDRSAEVLRNLPFLVTFLTVAASLVVALVVALLNILAFQARTREFAILLAIGQRRGRLAAKLGAECALLAITAWVVGVGVGVLAMVLYARYALIPNGIAIRPVDPDPIALSAMLPAIAVLASVLALWHRLRGLDPVSVIERRFA